MADNTTLPAAAGGDTIRTVDRTTSKTQVVGLDIGGEPGPESIVTPANPLPVTGVVQLSLDGLGAAGMDAALPVTLALDQPPVLVQVNPTGQQPMLLSLSIALAADQPSIPVIANQGVSPYNVAGTVAVSNIAAGTVSVSNIARTVTGTVAVSNLPATQAVSAVTLPLPAGAALETGGNLASVAASAAYLQQLVELIKQLLATEKANNLLLAHVAGISINPSDMLDDNVTTFQ